MCDYMDGYEEEMAQIEAEEEAARFEAEINAAAEHEAEMLAEMERAEIEENQQKE